MTRALLALLIALTAALGGCASSAGPTPSIYSGPLPQLDDPLRPRTVSEGSLYAETSAAELVGDFRARHIGDVLIVRIAESALGSSSADKKLDKSSSDQLKAPTPLGYAGKLAGKVGADFDPANAYDVSNTKAFDGKGETSRKNTLAARVAVRVLAVGAAGRMLVAGEKEITINQERQKLMLAGIVRPEDVGADNTIPSSSVADLKIIYGGKGDLNDMTRQGWFTKLLTKIWPF